MAGAFIFRKYKNSKPLLFKHSQILMRLPCMENAENNITSLHFLVINNLTFIDT